MSIDKLGPANTALPLPPTTPDTTGAGKAAAQPRTTGVKPHSVLSEPPPQQTGATTAPRRRAPLDSLRSALQASGTQAETIGKDVGRRMISGGLGTMCLYMSPAAMEITSAMAKKFAELRRLA